MACRIGIGSEPVDAAQDVGEQVFRNCHFGHLEDDIAPMADELRAGVNELLAQRRQRLLLDGHGIYLVFGFGDRYCHAMASRNKPRSAEELEDLSDSALAKEEARKFSVFAIDVSSGRQLKRGDLLDDEDSLSN